MGQTESGSITGDLSEEATRRVVLESDALRLTVMPALGGKISSIQVLPGGDELLQQPLQPYALRTPYMRFEAGDASGWDECLPSVAACDVKTDSGVAHIPDHGDFWQVPWSVTSSNKNELEMSADGFSLPLQFTKTLRLDGSSFHISYSVQNLSDRAVDYVWSSHPLFAVEPGDRIVLPESVKEVKVEGSARERLGKAGATTTWPNATAANHSAIDLTVAGKVTDGIGDKIFAVSPREGWCAIVRNRLKQRIELRFDPYQLPWLGLWICYGGWPENGTNCQQCVALEPCTAEGDSLAEAIEQGRARRLAPKALDRWSLEFRVGSVS